MAFTGKSSRGAMAFTGTSLRGEQIKLNLSELAAVTEQANKEHEKMLIDSFKGIPVRVDKSLDGFRYYICVSPELKGLLEQNYGPDSNRK